MAYTIRPQASVIRLDPLIIARTRGGRLKSKSTDHDAPQSQIDDFEFGDWRILIKHHVAQFSFWMRVPLNPGSYGIKSP